MKPATGKSHMKLYKERTTMILVNIGTTLR